jgi:hypothetical protein
MQALFLQHENALYVCKPVYDSLILCFICDRDANIGLIRQKSELLSTAVTDGLNDIKDLLEPVEDEEN